MIDATVNGKPDVMVAGLVHCIGGGGDGAADAAAPVTMARAPLRPPHSGRIGDASASPFVKRPVRVRGYEGARSYAEPLVTFCIY